MTSSISMRYLIPIVAITSSSVIVIVTHIHIRNSLKTFSFHNSIFPHLLRDKIERVVQYFARHRYPLEQTNATHGVACRAVATQ